MPRNMSTLDRTLRTVVATPLGIAIALLVGAGSVLGIVLLALAAVMLATSAAGFCPLYTLFHFDSRGRRPLPH